MPRTPEERRIKKAQIKAAQDAALHQKPMDLEGNHLVDKVFQNKVDIDDLTEKYNTLLARFEKMKEYVRERT